MTEDHKPGLGPEPGPSATAAPRHDPVPGPDGVYSHQDALRLLHDSRLVMREHLVNANEMLHRAHVNGDAALQSAAEHLVRMINDEMTVNATYQSEERAEIQIEAAERQSRALTFATWALVGVTAVLAAATIVLVAVTATHGA